ncbi:hypothetical protein V6N13_146538 [Hibiscus sabdariffa]|uniref:Uncharacterized protein n=1 Tax=Hibiscus sabdariffa TaxID=183260 RepID=A0ABR2TSW5_9ROSI
MVSPVIGAAQLHMFRSHGNCRQSEQQRPNQVTGKYLKVVFYIGLLQRGKQVHGWVTKTQFESIDYFVTGLVQGSAEENRG